MDSREQPFLDHVIELRSRILRTLMVMLVLFFPIYYFANDLYSFVAAPLMAHLPIDSSMIATEVASPFLTPFKLAIFAAIFVAMPYLLHQMWGFVSPGLYLHEKRFAMPLLASSILLFYAGIAFAFYVVFPLIFGFFTQVAPKGVEVQPDITEFLSFITTIIFAFGLAFEVPIATVLIVWTGLTTPQKLAKARPYVFLGAFVVGMFLTPPDVISQTVLAVPVYLLYELGIVMSRIFAIRETDDTGDAQSKD
ncbi:MAG: twin-arginine translocase subunit TatC [Pseudomonadales bacterium]|nr:twin-arginine translocase subunit TatC [Pseudomonadales bacterium]